MSGMMVERRDQVLMTFFSFAAFCASTFFNKWSSTNGPFFRLRAISIPYLAPTAASATTTNDQLIRRLTTTGAAFGLTPRTYRVTATRTLTFTTTKWVVDRVHCYTAGLGTNALPAVTTGLTDFDELVL